VPKGVDDGDSSSIDQESDGEEGFQVSPSWHSTDVPREGERYLEQFRLARYGVTREDVSLLDGFESFMSTGKVEEFLRRFTCPGQILISWYNTTSAPGVQPQTTVGWTLFVRAFQGV
jgi:hypothetical protein